MNADPSVRPLILLLTWGTRLAFLICLAGVFWMFWARPPVTMSQLHTLAPCPFPCGAVPGAPLVLAGIVALLAVSAGRLVLCAVAYLRAGDRVFGGISIGAFVLVMSAILLRLV